jgi:hypothetical protein
MHRLDPRLRHRDPRRAAAAQRHLTAVTGVGRGAECVTNARLRHAASRGDSSNARVACACAIARLSPPSRTESPSMNDEDQDPQAEIPAAADAERAPVERLEALGVRGILWQLARDGQIIDVRCEMPQCYCFRGSQPFRAEIGAVRLGADCRPLSETEGARRSPHFRQRPACAPALQPT